MYKKRIDRSQNNENNTAAAIKINSQIEQNQDKNNEISVKIYINAKQIQLK